MKLIGLILTFLLMASTGSVVAASRVRVVDGDTLDVDGVRYRLHGIDAPEAGQTCKTSDGKDWQCGQEAIHLMERLVAGRDVECSPREKDLYGRWIAVCKADGQEINSAMISAGMAWAFTKYSQDYVAVEQVAHQSHVGIWQAETEPAWEYRAHKWNSEITATTPNGSCPIKGNINRRNEKIYHPPWSKAYAKTKIDPRKGERWFCTEAEALAAGWRPAQWGR